MIPQFPSFKKLDLADKKDVEKFTSKFPPYSDFNFFSIWCWDIHKKIRISQLNENLVVLFNDYISGDQFLSFIGDQKVLETTHTLISFSKKNHYKNFLKFIPEEVFLSLKGSGLVVKTDRDSYDYIYLAEHLANMKNWTNDTPGREIRKFIKKHPNFRSTQSLINDITTNDYKKMFKKWSQNKNIDNLFELNEYKAFERFLKIKNKSIIFISIYVDNILIGFSIYEILSKNYAIAHFSKADTKNYPGIYSLLNLEEARFLSKKGIKYLNWEQDLGITGLRYSKEKYVPYFLMRKLMVTY